MTRLATLIVVLATLVVAPAAAAKEITSVKACGESGCVTTKDPAILLGLMNGGPPTVPQDPKAPNVRLTATITEPGGDVVGTIQSQWFPDATLLVGEDGTWMTLPDDAARALNALDVEPFPAIGAAEPTPAASAAVPPAASPAAPAAASPAAPADDGGVPAWLLIAGGLAIAGAIVAAALFAQRPRRGASAMG
jgi:hypothetical protein